jgi:hypothetical protein
LQEQRPEKMDRMVRSSNGAVVIVVSLSIRVRRSQDADGEAAVSRTSCR